MPDSHPPQPGHFALYTTNLATARGAERVFATLAQGLAARGHRIDLLLEDTAGTLPEQIRQSGADVRLIDLRAFADERGLRHRDGQLATWIGAALAAPVCFSHGHGAALAELSRFLRKNNPPVAALAAYMSEMQPAAVLSFLNHPNIALLLARKRLRTKAPRLYVSVRNTLSRAAAENESRWVQSVPVLMRRYFAKATGIVAPSRGVARDVVKITGLKPDRIALIHNPVYRPELLHLAEAPVDHPWLGDGGHPVLITAGKLKPQKDYPTLLKALAEVRKHRPVRLIVLGKGPDLDALKALCAELGIAEAVAFMGHVDNPYAWFRRAALFVQTSLWEGLPNALIEALACGCPVVSSDCESGPDEILDGGRYGALVPIGDVQGFAEAILRTLDQPPEHDALVARASLYSLDAALNAYEALLAENRVLPSARP